MPMPMTLALTLTLTLTMDAQVPRSMDTRPVRTSSTTP